jgi:hypothetical protein
VELSQRDGGGIILDMVCHWRYVLDNLFGEVESVSLHRHHGHSRSALTRRASNTRRPPTTSAYATFRLKGGVIAHINMSWVTRVYRDDLVTFQVDGTLGSAVAGLSDCVIQARQATPRPVWNPDEKRTHDFYADWQKLPENTRLRQRFQGAVGDVHSPRLRGRAVQIYAAGRRQGRAARRMRACRAGASGAGSTSRRSRCEERHHEQAGMPVSSLSLKLPTADAHRDLSPRGVADFPAKLEGTLNRVAFSAAHVVADPLADVDPVADGRDRLGQDDRVPRACLGTSALGVAEAMDNRAARHGAQTGRPRSN